MLTTHHRETSPSSPKTAPPESSVPSSTSARTLIDEPSPEVRSRAERNALWLAIHQPEDVVSWIEESLFPDPTHRDAVRTLLNSSSLHAAIEEAPLRPPPSSSLRLTVYGPPDDFNAEGTFIELVRQTTIRTITEARGRRTPRCARQRHQRDR